MKTKLIIILVAVSLLLGCKIKEDENSQAVKLIGDNVLYFKNEGAFVRYYGARAYDKNNNGWIVAHYKEDIEITSLSDD